MKKTTVVKTDDPEKGRFTLTVKGPVERVVTITPRSLYVKGTAGDTLEGVVRITPSEKHPFTITGLKQKGHFDVKAVLTAPKEDEKSWQVEMTATSGTPVQMYDLITLETDSSYLPTIPVRAYFMFDQKKEAQTADPQKVNVPKAEVKKAKQ